ncbi:MAG: small-conductance mechanosensitive channel, partial [Alphaproteobacteria bacterium]
MLRSTRSANVDTYVWLSAGIFALFWLIWTTAPLQAKGPETTSLIAIEQVIERARKEGMRVIVVDPMQLGTTKPPETSTAMMERLKSDAFAARQKLFDIVEKLPAFPGHLKQAILRLSPEKHLHWPLVTAGFAILFLLIAWLPRYLLYIWAGGALLAQFRETPQHDSERIGYLFARGTSRMIGLTVQLVGAVLLILAFDMGRDHLRYTALMVVAYWALISSYSIFMRNLLAIDATQYRTLNIGDDAATNFYRDSIYLFAVGIFTLLMCVWMSMLGIEGGAHTLAQVGSALLVAISLIVMAVRHRHTVGQMLFASRPEIAWPLWQRLTARLWHVPAIVYVVVAWAVMTVRLLLDKPNSIGLVGFPLIFVMFAIGLYGGYLLIVELYFTRRSNRRSATDASSNDGDDASQSLMTDASPFVFSPYKYLFERIGGYVAVIGVIIATTMLWGARPLTEGGSADVLLDILVVGLIAYVAWAVAKIAIDQKIAEAGPYVAAVPGEVGGAGASRLSTLLPLFGNFLLVAIAAVAFMIILTELGVNVTPLFAGAGIVGLAIGFGAQTLVRDILSGVFFLIDDAFRQGECIDVGDVKGTVESISLRSMQLRHHLGPLNTIPFGEIKNVKNFSRDWVIMKLPLRLTFDTDA